MTIREIWKDIPGFESSFQASNLGRIRSLDRIVPHARCGTQFVAGKILKPNVKRHYNQFKGDNVLILQVTLMLENVRYEFPVRRLVYAAFHRKTFHLSAKEMIVSIDGDGFNNQLSNLRKVTNSQRMKAVWRRGRAPKRGKLAPGKMARPTFALWKPVHQCDLSGKIIATYPCIAHAARHTGFYDKGIISAAKGHTKTYRGFKWKYAGKKHQALAIKSWEQRRSSGMSYQ